MPTLGRRRALGQHFLKDQTIAHLIAETALQEATKHQCRQLLEIGPGRGAITQPIVKLFNTDSSISSFLLVERDKALAEKWQGPEAPAFLSLVCSDFLDLEPKDWLRSGPVAVVSNLPYSAGTAILNRLAEQVSQIPVMVLMFQAEVAHRLRAEPGEKARGSLSVWIQNQWDVSRLVFVPPRAFSPPPEVDSEVVVLTRRSEPRVSGSTEPHRQAQWQSLLKISFAQRRQMLRKVLRSSALWQNALEQSGVDGTKRAETLQWQEWDKLFQAAKNVSPDPHKA